MGIARQTYLKELKKVRSYTGATGPTPVLHMITKRNAGTVPSVARGASAATVTPVSGPSDIYISKSTLKKIGHASSYEDRNTLDHELIHAFQKPALSRIGNGRAAETGAYRLAKQIARNNVEKRNRGYKKLGSFAKHGQFGA